MTSSLPMAGEATTPALESRGFPSPEGALCSQHGSICRPLLPSPKARSGSWALRARRAMTRSSTNWPPAPSRSSVRSTGNRFGGWVPATSAGALWLSPSNGTALGRVDARTGRLTIVQLPGFSRGQSVLNVVSGPGADTLYISAIDQMAAKWSQRTERFHPETGQFEVAASNYRFPIVRLIGVAGTVLWVWTMGGMMSHAAPASAATMTPLHCSIENTCTFNGLNGIFDVMTAGSLAWMSHAGGWLECAGGPTGSVRATVPRSGLRTDHLWLFRERFWPQLPSCGRWLPGGRRTVPRPQRQRSRHRRSRSFRLIPGANGESNVCSTSTSWCPSRSSGDPRHVQH